MKRSGKITNFDTLVEHIHPGYLGNVTLEKKEGKMAALIGVYLEDRV